MLNYQRVGHKVIQVSCLLMVESIWAIMGPFLVHQLNLGS